MSLQSMQKSVSNALPHDGMFDEMQREDFLALAAALRHLQASPLPEPKQQGVSRLASEPRLTLVLE